MAAPVVIAVEHVGKVYQLGQVGTGTLSHDLNRWWHRVRGRPDPYARIGRENDRSRARGKDEAGPDLVYALRDVSFEVRQGEVLGIIGRNGAGKSTLLKILSRVTRQTEGRIRVRGRIASLLEVGTGFHPELTGRENVFLNGAILGMTRREIARKFDEIVEFSGCARYVDTPVKRYSSGMTVRLAFAVAAHLEPEILVIDEVLAVGDAEFQKKCLGKMKDVSGEGRTVLFVSHNMTAVKSLCTRCLFVERGRIAHDGETGDVVRRYLRLDGDADVARADFGEGPAGSELVRLHGIEARGCSGRGDGLIGMEDPIRVTTDFEITRPGRRAHVTYHLLNDQGITVLTTGSPIQADPGRRVASFEIPGRLLNSGSYALNVLVVEDGSRVTWQSEGVVSFSVKDLARRDSSYMGREPSVVQVPIGWEVARQPAETASPGPSA